MIHKNQHNRQVDPTDAIAAYRRMRSSEDYINIDLDVANKLGIYESLLIELVQTLCQQNAATGKEECRHKGEWWAVATYEQWAKMYPALGSARKIQRAFLDLEKKGVIISCQPLKQKNGAKFYRVNVEAVALLENGGSENA